MKPWHLLMGLALTSCKQAPPPSAGSGSVPPGAFALPPDAEPSPPLPAASPRAPAMTGMKTLASQLQREAAGRPNIALSADAIVAALADAGHPVDHRRQYLALTARAAYCSGGKTAGGLAIVVCEYPSAAAAETGRQHVTRTFPMPAGARSIAVNGATTLTLTGAIDPVASAARAQIERWFLAL
jgi:hypothetical protein